MSVLDEQFKQAMAAFKAGRKDEARDLLLDIVDKDERHEKAWLFLSALVDSLDDQQTCLENVLELNPSNEKARQALEKVQQKLARRSPKNDSPPPTAPTASPAPPFAALDWDAIPDPPLPHASSDEKQSSAPPIGAEFATISGDSLVGGVPADNTVPFDDGGAAPDDALDWLSTPPAPSTESAPPTAPDVPTADPFASPTSVDWGQDTSPATHGSGQQVDLPSSQEYDDWVRNLNLGNGEPASAEPETLPTDADAENVSPFTPESVAPFGGTEYMLEEETHGADTPAAEETPSPFGVNMFEEQNAWDNEAPPSSPSAEASPFPAETSAALDSVSNAVFEGGTPFTVEDDAESSSEALFASKDAFEATSPVTSADKADFDFGSEPAALRPTTHSTGTTAAEINAGYFAQIPADIEPAPGITRRGVLLAAAIVVMIVLNGVSFALLF